MNVCPRRSRPGDIIDTGETLCFRVPPTTSGFGSSTAPLFPGTRHKYVFFKTKRCFHYDPVTRTGCKFGDHCSFAHGDAELRAFSR